MNEMVNQTKWERSKFPTQLISMATGGRYLDHIEKLNYFFQQQPCPQCKENWNRITPIIASIDEVINGIWDCEDMTAIFNDSPKGTYSIQCAILRDIFGNPYVPCDIWDGEHCQRCLRGYKDSWTAPDDLWKILEPYGYKLLCVQCFVEIIKHSVKLPTVFEVVCPSQYIKVNPEIMEWDNGTIPKMVCDMYLNNDFSGVKVLADALEESGFIKQDVMDHLRLQDQHWKGCWVLNCILEEQSTKD